MKKNDLIFVLVACIILLPFIPFGFLEPMQKSFLYSEDWWYLNSFLKFALLATLGEVLGLRIKTGEYNQQGFGIIPRAIVWGFLGITIKFAFIVFPVGVTAFLEKYFHIQGAGLSMKPADIFAASEMGLGLHRLVTAFSISVAMNLIYAPVMMTLHKITDTHIAMNGGTIGGLFRPIQFGKIFPSINWFVQWDFVFKRTIPFFWIPAHTITFLMAPQYRLVFAALLGVVLGVLLALASIKGNKK